MLLLTELSLAFRVYSVLSEWRNSGGGCQALVQFVVMYTGREEIAICLVYVD